MDKIAFHGKNADLCQKTDGNMNAYSIFITQRIR
jgi:hypothetical protein